MSPPNLDSKRLWLLSGCLPTLSLEEKNVVSWLMERPTLQATEGELQLTACEEWRSSVQTPVRNSVLPGGTRVCSGQIILH